MAIVLGANQYGKAETHLVRIVRDGPEHQIRDLTVTTSLRGDFAAAHLRGDQANVLPTDSQKNTVYAYARQHGVAEIEEFALALARHFGTDIAPVRAARVEIDEQQWERISTCRGPHPHAFVRTGQETRMTSVTVEDTGGAERVWVVSGLRDLVVLKSTGSEFAGFLTDGYTTLPPTHDRVLATSLTARWRYLRPDADWAAAYASVRQILVEQFAAVHSLALQQSLWEMGRAVLTEHPEIAEIRLSAPNKHHFLVDLSPFGLDNPGAVFHADDRPYGLIQCAVQAEDAPPAGSAWDTSGAFA
jgi:urate oxidase